jgi:hypothetical protein
VLAEYPGQDEEQQHRLLVSGLEEIRVRAEKVPETSSNVVPTGAAAASEGVQAG